MHCLLVVLSVDHIFNDLIHSLGVNLLADVVVKNRREILVVEHLLILFPLHLSEEIFTVASKCLLRLHEIYFEVETREEVSILVHDIVFPVIFVEQKPKSQTVFLARNVKVEVDIARFHLFQG